MARLDRRADGVPMARRGSQHDNAFTRWLDGTPVLDIKPYVPYADAHPQARGGFATAPSGAWLEVDFTPASLDGIARADPRGERRLNRSIDSR